MATSTTVSGLPYPELPDAANPSGDFKLLADRIDLNFSRSVANAGLLPATGTFPGQKIWQTDIKQTMVWDGSAWAAMEPLLMQRGRLTIVPVANVDTSVTVTYPVAYPNVPTVLISLESTSTAVKYWSVNSLTTTNFVITIQRSSASNTTVSWLAMRG